MRARSLFAAALPLLLLLTLGPPRPVHSQERLPFTLEQIQELLGARLAPSVILQMAGADCLAFRMDEESEGRLRRSGANDVLITGLRGVCYKGPEAEPETPPATSPTAARRTSGPSALNPGSAALRSLALPGLGQFYTGRKAVGAAFLVGWAGALGFGLMSQEVTVECLSRIDEGASCPAGEIRGEVVERPMLAVGLGAAVAVAVISALEARSGASRANARAVALGANEDPGKVPILELLPSPTGVHGGRLVLLQLRHR